MKFKVDTNKNCQELLNLFLTNGFIPTIIKPTRITHQTASLIDNLYVRTKSTKNLNIKSGIISTDISDHLPIYLELEGRKEQNKTETEQIMTRALNEVNIHQIKHDLAEINWNELIGLEINKAHTKFLNTLTRIIDKHATEQPLKLNKKRIKEK